MNARSLGTLLQPSSNVNFDRSYNNIAPKQSGSRFKSTDDHLPARILSHFESSNLRQQLPLEDHVCKPDELATLTSCLTTHEFRHERNPYKAGQDYSLTDWRVMKNDNFQASDRVKAAAELSRSDVERVVDGMEVSMAKNQDDSVRGMEDYEKNMKYWKGEVEKEMNNIGDSIKHLQKEEVRLVGVLEGCDKVLEVVLGCLKERGKRKEIERVVDVDPDLIKEAEMLQNFQKDLRTKLLQVKGQISHNRQQRQDMSGAVMLMFEAISLWRKGRAMTEGTRVHRQQARDCRPQPPICWPVEASSLVEKSQQLRAASQSLIDLCGQLTESQLQAFMRQWEGTNEKLGLRLEDYRRALEGVQGRLARTLQELAQVEVVREELKRMVRMHGEVESLAQSRRNVVERGKVVEVGEVVERRGVVEEPLLHEEAGKALKRLSREIMNLSGGLSELKGKAREVEWVESLLLRSKRALEHDMHLKNFSLQVDLHVQASRRIQLPVLMGSFPA